MIKLKLIQKERVSTKMDVGISIIAICIAFILCGIIVAIQGVNPFEALWVSLDTTLFTAYGLSEVLVKATPLLFCGLAVGIALTSKVWNIGAEGQLYIGAMFATAVVMHLPTMPTFIQLSVMVIAGSIGGAFWAFIPAVLKIRFKVDEIITTLLLNYVAIYLVDHLIFGIWKNEDNYPFTPEFPVQARLPLLGFERVHLGIILAIIATIIIYLLIKYSSWGYKVRLTGASTQSANYSGINVKRIMFSTFIVSGILAGLAGMSEVAGIQYKLQHQLSMGFGFTGIIVAWLARANPIGIVIYSLFMSAVITSSEMLEMLMGLPASMGTIAQGIILFAILGSELFKSYNIKVVEKEKK